jgi:SNF2 family DNA or RNA helicase
MTAFVPHKYQEEAVEFLLERGSAGLFLDPGLGKTSISLATFDILQKQGLSRGVLVVAPLRPCYLVWPKELKKWDDFGHLRHVVLHGPGKNQALRSDADVFVINPEGLAWLSEELKKLDEWPFDMLIVDESSRFKHTNTQRFKTLRGLLDGFKRRVILTGSPASTGLMDLFGQCYVMDRGATFGPYITQFRRRYFYQTGYGGYEWRLNAGAAEEIYEALAPRVLRMSERDYLKLPPLVVDDVEIELPTDVRRMYDQMESVLRLDFAKGRVVASNTGVASMKCRQIASGGVYLDDGSTKQLHHTKAEAVAELLEELSGQPALVAYEFEHDRERLLEVLGKDTPYIGGGVSAKRSLELERAWNAGELPVLLGQPQSIAHGLNLQEAGRAVIWHTLTWKYEDYDQFIRRVWRQGQKGRVFVYRILARGTIDYALRDNLSTRGSDQNALFRALKEYFDATR